MKDLDVGVSRLLNAARAIAVGELDGKPATKDNLDLLAATIRREVLRQADRGLWTPWYVDRAADVAGLVVTARRSNPLLRGIEPPIVVEWDWSKTKLARMVVTCEQVS